MSPPIYVLSRCNSATEHPRNRLLVVAYIPDHYLLYRLVLPFLVHLFFGGGRDDQVLANVTVALGAMGVGALGLPLDLSNLVGGLMVLLLAAFGRFLLNGTRIPWGKQHDPTKRLIDRSILSWAFYRPRV